MFFTITWKINLHHFHNSHKWCLLFKSNSNVTYGLHYSRREETNLFWSHLHYQVSKNSHLHMIRVWLIKLEVWQWNPSSLQHWFKWIMIHNTQYRDWKVKWRRKQLGLKLYTYTSITIRKLSPYFKKINSFRYYRWIKNWLQL